MKARRIGILGGTFDPIHVGHVDIGLTAADALSLTRIFVITSNIPPHRPQPHASSFHRFAMVTMAVSGMDGWRALDVELRAGAQSFTTGTLKLFHERGYSPAELFFIIGADAFFEIGAWKDYPAVLDEAHFVVVSRRGFPVGALPTELAPLSGRMTGSAIGSRGTEKPLIWLIDSDTADVSSSAIRERRAAGLPITGLVHRMVEQHIEQHGLYTSMVPDRRGLIAPFST